MAFPSASVFRISGKCGAGLRQEQQQRQGHAERSTVEATSKQASKLKAHVLGRAGVKLLTVGRGTEIWGAPKHVRTRDSWPSSWQYHT